MEDALLDVSQDELIKETQHGDSPATFSRNLVDHFNIIGHNTQTGSETINPTDNIPYTGLFFITNSKFQCSHLKFHISLCFYQKIQYSYQYSYTISTAFHKFNFTDAK